MPDATIVICEKGIIQSFNAAAERLFGHREAEVMLGMVGCEVCIHTCNAVAVMPVVSATCLKRGA